MASAPTSGATYDIFISYSRKNHALAAALEARLERYRPPDGLDLPRRHLRVFRDEGDLTGTDYYDAIDEALRASAKMVLICSPYACASEFVNDEVRRFLAARGPEHVVPVLAAGIPNNEATPETADQCAFPPALLEAMEMPLATPWLGFDPAADRVDRGRFEGSWYTLLANVLDRTREAVEERTRKREQRRRRVAASIVAGVVVSLAALSVWALVERGEARSAQAVAESRLMASRALQPPRGDPLYALVHGLSGLLRAETYEAAGALLGVVEEPRVLRIIGHRGPVNGAWVGPDGRILTISSDSTARITDTVPDAAPLVLAGHGAQVRFGGWSPDGTRVLTGADDGRVRVWDAATGGVLSEIELPDAVTFASYGAGGRRIVTAHRGGPVRLWSPEGDSVAVLGGPVEEDAVVAIDPSGGTVATGARVADEPVRLWRLDDGAPVRALLPEPAWPVVNMAFSADGARLATSTTGARVLVWDVAGGALVAELPPADGIDVAGQARESGFPWEFVKRMGGSGALVALDSVGRRVAVASLSTGTVGVHDLDRPDAEPLRLTGHRATLTDVDFDASGRWIVSASEDATVLVWEAATGHPLERYGGHERAVRAASFSADGRWVGSGSIDYTARVWEVRRATRNASVLRDVVGRLAGGPDGRSAFSVDGRYVASVAGQDVHVWGTSVGDPVLDHPAGSGRRFGGSAFSPDGTLLAVLWRRPAGTPGPEEVEVVEVATGRVLGRVAEELRLRSVGFTPAGDRVLLVADSVARVVDWTAPDDTMTVSTLPLNRIPIPVAQRLRSAVSSPDGGYLAAVVDSGVHLRTTAASEGSVHLSLAAWPHTVAFSGDGTRMVVANDSVARVFDVVTAAPVSPPIHHPRAILTAALDSAGSRVVTGVDDFTAVMWDVETGQALRTLSGHVANVLDAGFGPGGRLVFTYAPADGTVRLWDAESGRAHAVFPGPAGDSIVGAWFAGSADGRLVLGTREGAVRVFRTERCALLSHAFERLPVAFTDSAWAAVLDGLPVPDLAAERCPLE
ncbi:MAG: TIR domain-containing protein [Longimicrobiales bacterium]